MRKNVLRIKYARKNMCNSIHKCREPKIFIPSCITMKYLLTYIPPAPPDLAVVSSISFGSISTSTSSAWNQIEPIKLWDTRQQTQGKCVFLYTWSKEHWTSMKRSSWYRNLNRFMINSLKTPLRLRVIFTLHHNGNYSSKWKRSANTPFTSNFWYITKMAMPTKYREIHFKSIFPLRFKNIICYSLQSIIVVTRWRVFKF